MERSLHLVLCPVLCLVLFAWCSLFVSGDDVRGELWFDVFGSVYCSVGWFDRVVMGSPA
ncbi:hypothetical protein ACLVWQ_18330 [Streptomyces sp. CWNU-52B]|uniref:hypothetical protein n=1 Tax=unclassified Streptomyces TaxID=2593676 RepID=UPI0039C142CE